jgi:non-heme chloroperoxidase
MKRAIFSNFMTIHRLPNYVQLISGAITCILVASSLYAQESKVSNGSFTTSDGVRLHYLEAGKGPAIVFVPGWTMPAWIWERQIRHFSEHYRVLTFDPRSQGQSHKPDHGNYPDRRAQDIKELVEHMKVGPAVLVGWLQAVPELLTYAEKFGGGNLRAYVLVDGFAWDKHDPQFISCLLSFYLKVEGDRQKSSHSGNANTGR